VHKAAGDGELMQFPSYFATVGQPHKSQDRSTELDAKRAVLAAGQSAR
jgi:hypothetical protein